MARKLTYQEVKEYIESNSDCKLLSTEYIDSHKKLKLLCECGEIFETTYATIKKMKKIRCKKCVIKSTSKKNMNSYEDVLKTVEEKIGERFTILPFEYKGKQKTNIDLICKKCGKEISRLYHTINTKDIKCECEFQLEKWTKERAIILVYEYTNDFEVLECKRGDAIILKHKNCGCEFSRAFWNIQQNQGVKCPLCDSKESLGVKIITEYLEDNDIEYIKEYRFSDCKDIKTLPFDFYLPKYNICIEYDGQQHFKPNGFSSSEEHFIKTIKHDEMKNKYCQENNIHLVRIRYDENKNIKNILSNILK